MKAEDLMIGDWVLGGMVPQKVKNITQYPNGGCVATDVDDWNDDQLQPIPITPEMLDKNGFEQHINNLRHPQCSYFELADWSVGWCVHLYPMPNCKYFLETSAHMGRTIAKTTTAKVIEYIHELQHALKYSEIEKEIVL